MAAVADRHPTGPTAKMFPRLGGTIEIKPAQLAGGSVALWTRLGSGGVKLLALGDGVFPLQPLILPGGFDIIRFLKAENITGGSVSDVPSFFIDESTHHTLRRSHLQPNDLLVVIAGATTGKAGVLGAELTPANANQAVCFVRFRDAQMSRFCNEWLSLSPVRDLMLQRAVQSAQPNLAMPDLGAIPVVKMPDTELDQVLAHIGNIKERFVKLLSAYTRQLELLTEYRAALIHECVTGQWAVPA